MSSWLPVWWNVWFTAACALLALGMLLDAWVYIDSARRAPIHNATWYDHILTTVIVSVIAALLAAIGLINNWLF